ncbi:hypothetical protein ROHU_030011 [Labeo rohita]|uniref:Uncharacterized protein n=1 Tax=Labeo rohita TaxID=84645 RepID=A0A498LV32_LABRO|nr:hypothetical protein ROHU_030011 [Labeo rohita]
MKSRWQVDWQQTGTKENSIDGVSEHLRLDWLPTGMKENRTDEVSEHLRKIHGCRAEDKQSLMTNVGIGDPYSEKEAAVNTTATEEPKSKANGAVEGLNN